MQQNHQAFQILTKYSLITNSSMRIMQLFMCNVEQPAFPYHRVSLFINQNFLNSIIAASVAWSF